LTIKVDKNKTVIIKSKMSINFEISFNNQPLEAMKCYGYLGVQLNHKITCNISIEKIIFVGWKAYYGPKIHFKDGTLALG
jgi:hypothetical protein